MASHCVAFAFSQLSSLAERLPLSAKDSVDVTQMFRVCLSCLELQALGSLQRYVFIRRCYLGMTVSAVPKPLSCLKPCRARGETGTPHPFGMLLWCKCKVRACRGIDWNHVTKRAGFGGTCQSSPAAVFPRSFCRPAIVLAKDLQLAQLLCI